MRKDLRGWAAAAAALMLALGAAPLRAQNGGGGMDAGVGGMDAGVDTGPLGQEGSDGGTAPDPEIRDAGVPLPAGVPEAPPETVQEAPPPPPPPPPQPEPTVEEAPPPPPPRTQRRRSRRPPSRRRSPPPEESRPVQPPDAPSQDQLDRSAQGPAETADQLDGSRRAGPPARGTDAGSRPSLEDPRARAEHGARGSRGAATVRTAPETPRDPAPAQTAQAPAKGSDLIPSMSAGDVVGTLGALAGTGLIVAGAALGPWWLILVGVGVLLAAVLTGAAVKTWA